MKVKEILSEVKIDNNSGIGVTPNNKEIDYFGIRVSMRPSTFLRLALELKQPRDDNMQWITDHIKSGGAISSPWFSVMIPDEWIDGDFTKMATIIGHEGRHRMHAILNVEGDVATEVHMLFRGKRREWRARHVTPEIIQALNRGMVAEEGRGVIQGPLFKGIP